MIEITPKIFKIVEYIKQHPGCSKENVVRGMNGNPSRITVLNIITELEQDKMIIARKERPNSQIYKLFINNDNLIVSVDQDLLKIKDAFHILFSKLGDRIKKSSKVGGSDKGYFRMGKDRQMIQNKISHMNYAIIQLYRHLIGMYMIGTLFFWPQKVEDKESSIKLNLLVFSRLGEIQSEISKYFFTMSNNSENVPLRIALDHSFELIPSELALVIEGFRNFDLSNECKSILDPLWKISMDFIPTDIAFDLFQTDDKTTVNVIKGDWKPVYDRFMNRFLASMKQDSMKKMKKSKDSIRLVKIG